MAAGDVNWNWGGQPQFDDPSQMWGYTGTDTYTPVGDWGGNTRYGDNPISESVIGSNLWWDKIRRHYEGFSEGSMAQSNYPGAYKLHPGYYRSDNPRGRAIYQQPSAMTNANAPGGTGTYNYFSSQLPTLGWVTSGGTFNRNPDWTPNLMPSDISWSKGGDTPAWNAGGQVTPPIEDPIEDPIEFDSFPEYPESDEAVTQEDLDRERERRESDALVHGIGTDPNDPIDGEDPLDPTKKTKLRVKGKTFYPAEDFIRDSVGG